jgi:hypothetical protein
MKQRFALRSLWLITLLALPHAARAAETARALGSFGDADAKWTAYVAMEGGNKVCYIAGQPKKSAGDYKKRGQIFALVTHRPSEGSKNVFSFVSGYDYKPQSDATVTIDKQTITLFTQNDTAWAPDAATDQKIATALRHGSTMTIKGGSAHGAATVDTFALKGSGDALKMIDKECGS